MRTIVVIGRPHHEEPEVVSGRVGIESTGGAGIEIIPGSVSFTVNDRTDHAYGPITRREYIVTMADGRIVRPPARGIRKMGLATRDADGTVRWSDKS